MRIALLFVLCFAACRASTLPAPPAAPAPAASAAERWVQDARYAIELVERWHPDPYDGITRAQVEAELAAMEAERGRLDESGAFLRFARLLARFGDSHTRLGSWQPVEDLELPLHFESSSDGFHVASVQADCAARFGCRLLAIGGVPIEVAVQRLAPFVPHENEILLEVGAARLLSLPRVLVDAGLASGLGAVRLRLADPSGVVSDVDVPARPRAELGAWCFVAPSGWEAPLWRTRPEANWWWTELVGSAALYVRYDNCRESSDRPFAALADEILSRIDAGGIERCVIDLRRNGGGDSGVLRPLERGLAERVQRLPARFVRVLIDRHTYSSGMLNAWRLARDCAGVLIGESTSQKPDCFGEVRSALLPNTGWRLDVSTKRFRLVGDERPSLEPDFHVPVRFADLLAGIDPVLDAALADLPAAGSSTPAARRRLR
jgi:hypothetical protein